MRQPVQQRGARQMQYGEQPLAGEVLVGDRPDEDRRKNRAQRHRRVNAADRFAREVEGVEILSQDDEPGSPDREFKKIKRRQRQPKLPRKRGRLAGGQEESVHRIPPETAVETEWRILIGVSAVWKHGAAFRGGSAGSDRAERANRAQPAQATLAARDDS